MIKEEKSQILLYTDGSDESTNSIRFLRAVLQSPQFEAHLVAVAETAGEQAATDMALETGQEFLAEAGVQSETHARSGDLVVEITQEIEDGDYGLLVAGLSAASMSVPHNLSEIVRLVVKKQECSILFVRGQRTGVSKILACTGGYRYGEEVIRVAACLAQTVGAEVTILYVTEALPLMYTGLQEMEEPLPALLKTHTREAYYLKRGARILKELGVSGGIKLAQGEVTQEILRASREGDYDIIALGASREHPFLQQLLHHILLGEVTQTILNDAEQPVLIVPSRPKTTTRQLTERIRFTRRHR
ncbi:MAG: universal stress protein [Chloroflexi bacterium]|nr:universal stress protein [Chloroflexota bacterium]